ncbi:chromate resistance protein ChrB domain-containing protein [Sphingomonas sp.]|uniref:chromate resistance protein ChrB domain-containing protein n=1 Tax=Sphingomonas sp. TaxID=28214 RepID=UPI00286E16ED|nr:chromate resistance protein ChrB domain-containing protein [Sphingomonas sp.]
MPAFNSISADQLARLMGTPAAPVIIDVRPGGEGLIPGARRYAAEDVAGWAGSLARRPTVVVCVKGEERSAGVAAWLRSAGIDAEMLEGGFDGWAAAGQPVVAASAIPPRNADGHTVWVTRARPKVDRIACPWLIRRFVDPDAVLLFVAPGEVAGVAERFGATPFDVDGVFWSHRGELCTFDVMIEQFGLGGVDALQRLAVVVRGADTARLDLAPQAAGLLALSLGLSRMFTDDLAQLDAGMILYDALYRWCRDAVDETHDWVSHTPKPRAGR